MGVGVAVFHISDGIAWQVCWKHNVTEGWRANIISPQFFVFSPSSGRHNGNVRGGKVRSVIWGSENIR